MDAYIDANWIRGINSLIEASLLQEGEYQWGVNIDNSGGIIQTRQGWTAIGSKLARLPAKEPNGGIIFRDRNNKISIVISIGNEFWACDAPFLSDFYKIGNGFSSNLPVVFCKAFKSLELNPDGTTTVIEPYPVLIAQNGIERARYWDGATWSVSDPTLDQPGIPIGSWMQWSGGRLWVATGSLLHASDLANPVSFFEETYVAGGGALFFEDDITGINQTPNLQSLLVATDFNTSAIQANVFDRTTWGATPGFQRVLLPGIGCAAGKSFCRQWGMTWWMSHGGFIALDQALNTYRSSKIVFQDQAMMRSKSNLADNISGITASSFGNYLVVAVPSGDKRNAHIWVLNQNVLDRAQVPSVWASAWTGIKPIEFLSGVIDGGQRLFALSREDGDGTQAFYPNVWEMFTGERQDRFNDYLFHPPCAFETRLLATSQELKKFNFAELDLAEVIGQSSIQVYVASRRGGYQKILDKQITAAEGSANSPITSQFVTTTRTNYPTPTTTIDVVNTAGSLPAPATIYINGVARVYNAKTAITFTVTDPIAIPLGTQVIQPQFSYPANPTMVSSFVPQRRIIRTNEWEIKSSDLTSCPVESQLLDNIDRGFSILVKWTGRLAITGLRVFTTTHDDQTMGRCEDNEILSRSLDETGEGQVATSLIEPPTIDSPRLKSKYLSIITPKHLDDPYLPIPSAGAV